MLGPLTGWLQLLIGLFIVVLFVRALISWVPSIGYTQLGRVIITATEWYLAPIRRVIPPMGGLDISFIVGILILYLLSALIGSTSVFATLVSLIGSLLIFLVILLVLRVVVFFFRMDPWHPITQALMVITDPLVTPFRTWFRRPRYGQFDWAPIVAIVVLMVIWWVITNLASFGLHI
jgi:YggT family protein